MIYYECDLIWSKSAVDSLALSHGCLDVQSLDILPALLQQRNQEVDTHVDILSDLFRRVFNSGDGSSHA